MKKLKETSFSDDWKLNDIDINGVPFWNVVLKNLNIGLFNRLLEDKGCKKLQFKGEYLKGDL